MFIFSEYECSKYPSCEWNDSSCNLKEFDSSNGYQISGAIEELSQGFRQKIIAAETTGMGYGRTIQELYFEVEYYTADHLRFKVRM
jgi:hypothetical protein